MIEESYQRCLYRLLLTFSDLAETDQEIALCLTFMRIAPPTNETQWTAELVRRLMPSAYSAVSANSEYAADRSNQAATAYCIAVYRYIKQKGSTNE